MADYDDIRSFFDEHEGMRELASGASAIGIVSSIELDVDPLWMVLHDVDVGLLPRWVGRWVDAFDYSVIRHHVETPFRLRSHSRHGQLFESLNSSGYRRRDLYRTVQRWEQTRQIIPWEEHLPVIMTVVHRPLRSPELETESEQDDQEQLRRLVSLVNDAPFLVRIEERPEVRLSLQGGDAIHTNTGRMGTLGGLLHDGATGKTYGVTCAHVASMGDQVKDSNGTALGRCTYSTGLVRLAGGGVCDPTQHHRPKPYPGNGPSINMLDCALIDLNPAVNVNQSPPFRTLASGLSQGQHVTVHGARRRVHCKLGALVISCHVTSNRYCFRDAIELVPQPIGPVGGKIGQLVAVGPTQGDSGAWAWTQGTSGQWAAMLFAEDGTRGFGIRASWVHQWAENVTGAALMLL